MSRAIRGERFITGARAQEEKERKRVAEWKEILQERDIWVDEKRKNLISAMYENVEKIDDAAKEFLATGDVSDAFIKIIARHPKKRQLFRYYEYLKYGDETDSFYEKMKKKYKKDWGVSNTPGSDADKYPLGRRIPRAPTADTAWDPEADE